jgi:hypothetical protein
MYNYADDNTLSYTDQDYNTLINVLEKKSSILIEWFNHVADNQKLSKDPSK